MVSLESYKLLCPVFLENDRMFVKSTFILLPPNSIYVPKESSLQYFLWNILFDEIIFCRHSPTTDFFPCRHEHAQS